MAYAWMPGGYSKFQIPTDMQHEGAPSRGPLNKTLRRTRLSIRGRVQRMPNVGWCPDTFPE